MTHSATITRKTKLSDNRRRLHYSNGHFSIRADDGLHIRPETNLFGLPLTNSTLSEAAVAIVERAKNGQRSIIQFINAHCVNILKSDLEYCRALSRADALLPDGSGISLAAKFSKKKVANNLNGTDLFPVLCQTAATEGQAIFLFGGTPGIAAATAKNMRNTQPGLKIAGARNGFFNPEEEQSIIDEINASNATILLVGMGVPRQEIWIAKNRNRINIPVILGVGGLFDYYSGRIPRAPLAFRKLGMEWSWRLMQEPRRLAKRYLFGNPLFVCHALVFAWTARGHAEAYAKASRRTLDLSIALLALVLLGPLFAALSLLITTTDRGPTFFRQTRIGADGKPFTMWKFRTMTVNAEGEMAELVSKNERDSICFKMKKDPRITKVGAWLRRFSMDELPQIFNVLKGEMSIVGPRPALPQEVAKYDSHAMKRLKGNPGLTCSWQVSGRADIPFNEQVELDIAYLEKRSIFTDLKMILKTVPAVVTGKGAY